MLINPIMLEVIFENINNNIANESYPVNILLVLIQLSDKVKNIFIAEIKKDNL
jgi:hypothetical protein